MEVALPARSCCKIFAVPVQLAEEFAEQRWHEHRLEWAANPVALRFFVEILQVPILLFAKVMQSI